MEKGLRSYYCFGGTGFPQYMPHMFCKYVTNLPTKKDKGDFYRMVSKKGCSHYQMGEKTNKTHTHNKGLK